MTAQAPWKKAPAAPKAPGLVARKSRQAAEHALRAFWPYLAAFASAALLSIVTGEGWLLILVLGAIGWHGVLRLHEGYGWHRRGGRAAARKRRKYQGPASRREIEATLSLRAIRKRAHVTRPATERPRQLPPSELGVLIGQTVRRSR
jgi:hypothetical protein